MASYNYNTISESPSSFQDKFLEYSKNWEDSDYKEKKRVKIIKEGKDLSKMSLPEMDKYWEIAKKDERKQQ